MVPISPQAYSGSAVVFDTRPIFNYAQKLEERRAKRALAEQEAFDEWNKANERQLDPTNIRWSKEGDQFTRGLQEYKSLAIEAKNNPRDYAKKIAAQKKADELIFLVRASKEAKEVDKEYNSFLRSVQTNPEQRKTTDLDAVLRDKAIHDLPIGFPGAPFLGIPKRPDDTSPKMNYYKPAPVDTYDIIQKNLGGVEMGELEQISQPDKNFQYNVVPKYTTSAIKTIAERVAKSVMADPLLESSYKVKGQQYDAQDLAKLNFLVKSVKDASGKPVFDIEVDIDDPASIAFGEAVEDLLNRRGKVDTVTDQVALERYKSNLRKSEKSEKEKEAVSLSDYDVLGKYNNNIFSKNNVRFVLDKDVDPQDKKLITADGQVKPYSDATGRKYFIVKDDGNWEGRGGQVINRSGVARANLDKTSLSEEKRGALNFKEKEPAYSIKGKTYSQSQLLKMYTQDQINQALKAGRVKIKQ